jgi:GNAT superfamily N-acetyltransferase
MKAEIRRIQEADYEALFGLVVRFASSFVAQRAAFDEAVRALVQQEDAWLAGAHLHGRLVAYCLVFDHLTFYANGRVAWIEEIMVDDSHRRTGIGRELTAAAEDWARSRGARLVALATRRASAFYEALGYDASATYFRKLL